MNVHLLDGTYELFRHFFALPSYVSREGREVAATRGVLTSVLGMLESGVTHLGVATDHVIESFRNDLWPGYKTAAGMDPSLLQQFPLLEESLAALGVVVWPMTDLEADDALGTAATVAGAAREVDRVYICTPDKDLAQCVEGRRIVQLDRRLRRVMDEAGVVAKFGVRPASIPDYLALVGDSSDGFPGLPGWGAKSADAVLARYGHIVDIPPSVGDWPPELHGARFEKLATVLGDNRKLAALFRDLATLRTNAPIDAAPSSLRWEGPTPDFRPVCERLDMPQLFERANSIKGARTAHG